MDPVRAGPESRSGHSNQVLQLPRLPLLQPGSATCTAEDASLVAYSPAARNSFADGPGLVGDSARQVASTGVLVKGGWERSVDSASAAVWAMLSTGSPRRGSVLLHNSACEPVHDRGAVADNGRNRSWLQFPVTEEVQRLS